MRANPVGNYLNKSHPFARGLFIASNYSEGGRVLNLVDNKAATLVGSPTWHKSPYGKSIRFNGTSQYLKYDDKPQWDMELGTYAIRFKIVTNIAGYNMIAARATTNGAGDSFLMFLQDDPNNNFGGIVDGTSIFNAGSSNAYVGIWITMTMVYNRTNIIIYLNGKQLASTGKTGAIAASNDVVCIAAGNNSGTFNEFSNIEVDTFLASRVPWSPASVARFHNDPQEVFRMPLQARQVIAKAPTGITQVGTPLMLGINF